nr:MAG TPA: hypothetical protein [Caudoviricetes sp.]
MLIMQFLLGNLFLKVTMVLSIMLTHRVISPIQCNLHIGKKLKSQNNQQSIISTKLILRTFQDIGYCIRLMGVRMMMKLLYMFTLVILMKKKLMYFVKNGVFLLFLELKNINGNMLGLSEVNDSKYIAAANQIINGASIKLSKLY